MGVRGISNWKNLGTKKFCYGWANKTATPHRFNGRTASMIKRVDFTIKIKIRLVSGEYEEYADS